MRAEELFLTRRLPYALGRDVQQEPNLLPGRAGAPSLPAVTGTLSAWYDPSDPLARTLTGSGRNLVSSLADKSGNGKTLVSLSGNPSLVVPATIRRPMMFFHGLATYMGSSQSQSDISGAMFVVACLTLPSGFPTILGQAGGNSGLDMRANSSGNVALFNSENGSFSHTTTATFTFGVPFVCGFTFSSSGCTSYLNRTSSTTSWSASLPAGRTLRLGRNENSFGGNEDPTNGMIGEIVYYSDTLSSGDALSVVEYLISKWGIAA